MSANVFSVFLVQMELVYEMVLTLTRYCLFDHLVLRSSFRPVWSVCGE
jgi:hypothetical protein